MKMPFKSKAQQRAMHAKASEGKIAPATIKEFDKSTNFKNLPETASNRPKKKSLKQTMLAKLHGTSKPA